LKPQSKVNSHLRIGIIGFGRFAQRRLLPAFEQISCAEIEAIHKRQPGSASIAAQKAGIPKAYDRYEELLQDPAIDAVYITSANKDHTEHAVAAAQAGKHILCEKPLANTPEDCEKIIRNAEEAGVKLMVAQTLRYIGPVQKMKQWIDSGKLGEIVSARACFTYSVENSPRKWVKDKQVAGGGPLIDLGVHCIDTLRCLCGQVIEAFGITTPDASTEEIELSAEGLLRFEGDVQGSIFCSYQTPYWSRLDVWGENGHAWVEPFTLPWTDVEMHFCEKDNKSSSEIVHTGNPYGQLIEDFCAAITRKAEIAIPGEEGLINQRIINAIYDNKKYQKR